MASAWRAGHPCDPYGTLGLPTDATAEEAKARYRELALECHPDRDGSDGRRFKEIREAYETIMRGEARGGAVFRPARSRAGRRHGSARRPAHGGAGQGEQSHMEMTRVSSSNLAAVGYDARTGTLRIAFKGGVYDYYGVPERVYLGLMAARSKGAYHARHIKWKYRYERVG